MQEVRALPSQLSPGVQAPTGWHAAFAPAQRLGYSGVAIYSRQAPSRVQTSLGEERFDVEGRFIAASFGRLSVASVYFPKGSGKDRDNSRVPYKLEFYAAAFKRLQALRRRGPVFVVGDYNTAHEAIDLARPKGNEKTSGFLPEERAELSRWLQAGWVDAFRAQHPGEPGHYTWWRQWGGARGEQRGLADRLCARLAERGQAGDERLHLAKHPWFGPLPGGGGLRVAGRATVGGGQRSAGDGCPNGCGQPEPARGKFAPRRHALRASASTNASKPCPATLAPSG